MVTFDEGARPENEMQDYELFADDFLGQVIIAFEVLIRRFLKQLLAMTQVQFELIRC